MMITQEELKKRFDYDKNTGLFKYRVDFRNGSKKGDIAGNKEFCGYWVITINGRKYKAHRLAWLYVYGEFPKDQLDHINCKKDDNRISNLRQATRSQNHMNRHAYSNNALGVKGVYKQGNKFCSHIQKNKKRIHLGTFETIKEAYAVYVQYSKEMHGKFSRT